jgi:nicotinate phosphoribosyltransferase
MQTLNDQLGLYTDFYELTMAQGYFLSGKKDEQVTFDYFFRTNPYDGGYLVFAGLGEVLRLLEYFNYSDSDIEYLEKTGLHPDFIKYLRHFRFRGKIISMREGEIVFPGEPILRIEGNIIEAQLIETMLLNLLNFQSLVATKAFRIKLVSKAKTFIDFGLRRAHGLGGIHASRAAVIGGASATSNVLAAKIFDIPVSGTLAHSWIQSFDDELEAFRTFAEIHPDNTILLVDTYDTLKSGVPNAIKIAKEMEPKGQKMIGIRLDSGDLAYFSKRARKQLDAAGLDYVKIFASNQLNEHVVKSLDEQEAPIDAFGIGTEMVTGKPEAALDGVYKLAECNGTPRMKISENIEKVTLPGKKEVYRYYDEEGFFYRDGILLANENPDEAEYIYHPHHPEKYTRVSHLKKEKLLHLVYEDGQPTEKQPSLTEIHNYLMSRSALLPSEHKRFIKAHIYKVGISKNLYNLRCELMKKVNSKLCQTEIKPN